MRVGRFVLAVMIAVVLLAGVAPAHAAQEGTMTLGIHVTLVNRWLDPGETEGLITPYMVLYALHDALVKPMPAGISAPSLAESWTVSKDWLTYDFVIRKNAKFHNGDPVTAEDVKFSFDRYRGASAKLLKSKVKEIQLPAPNRVRFVLKEAWPDFMAFYGTSATGAGWIVPKKYTEKVGEDGFKKAPVGAGPFKFVSFNPGVELVLEAFPDYWRKPPQVKRLVMRSIPDESTRAAAVKTGEVDFAYLFGGAVGGFLQTIGIRTRVRSMERAAYLAAWREKKLKGLLIGASGAAGNAAARLEPFLTKGGIYAYGSLPEIDDLFQRQAKEMDRKQRETLLHQIQRIVADRTLVAPIFQQGFIWGVGSRVAESGATLIQGYPYAAPAEDLKLK